MVLLVTIVRFYKFELLIIILLNVGFIFEVRAGVKLGTVKITHAR